MLYLLLLVVFGLSPFLIWMAALRERLSFSELLSFSGGFWLIAYITFVAFPYFFQGYSALTDPLPGEPMGITKWRFAATFAYIFTFPLPAFLWLTLGTIQVVLGRTTKHTIADRIYKSTCCGLYAFLLFEAHNFERTINAVLE